MGLGAPRERGRRREASRRGGSRGAWVVGVWLGLASRSLPAAPVSVSGTGSVNGTPRVNGTGSPGGVTGRDAGRCVAVAGLVGLAPDQQAAMTTLCERRGRPQAEHAPLVARLAARASWEASALAELLAGGAPHVDIGGEAGATARLLAARRALAGLDERRLMSAGCKPLATAIAAYESDLAERETPVPPFSATTLADGRCVPLAAQGLADVHLLTLAAEPGQALFVAAAAGERAVLQWFAPEEAIVRGERRLFVVVVPAWSVVTVRASHSDAATARSWGGFVTHDRTVWDDPPEFGCLRLSVDLDADTTLLIDGKTLSRGQRLAHRTVGVQAGPHELVALRCAAPGQCVVRFRETLPPAATTGTQNLCQDVALDLHQPRSVAIVRASAAPGCDAAMAWQADLLAAEYLRSNEARTGRVFRDLASYATLTTALGSLRDSLNPATGATVGGATGSDSLETVATVAKEAWRQGIDELVSLELRCGSDGTSLSLQGSAISVREVFGRDRGEVAGLDLKQLLRVQTLRFRSQAQLESTVGGVLDQLLNRSYLRIREGQRVFPYRSPARVELAAFGQGEVDGKPELAAFYLGVRQGGAAPVCQALRRDHATALAGVDVLLGGQGALTSVRVAVTGSEPALQAHTSVEGHDEAALRAAAANQLDGSFTAIRAGDYLVVARWVDAQGKPGPAVDATCVRFEVPTRELWASVMFAPDLTMVTPIRDYRAHHLRALLGQTWYTRRPWLGLGVAGGYAYTRYASAAGLPSWQDFEVTGQQSVAPLEWHRHALVVGPLVELRTRRASLPVEFRARVSAAVGLAIVDVHRVTGFPDFATASSFGPSNLRVTPTLDSALELGFSYPAGPLTIGHVITLGTTGLTDMNSGSRAVSAIGGASMYSAFGLILGGAR